MNDIRRALTRKFGPLPAWAWAAIAGLALFMYRRNAALGAGSPANTSATSPSQTDTTASKGDPTTLQPGESVYDPNTGQLLGTSDDQQPNTNGTTPTDPLLPITLSPGETVYDPNTHTLLGGPPAAAAAVKKAAAKKKKVTKRTKKAKPQHKKSNPVNRTNHAKKPRGSGKLRNPLRSKGKQPTSHRPARSRKPATTQAHGTRQRHRTPPVKTPAIRQRPAAPSTVHHDTQQVARHPARFAPKAHQAVAPPAPKRKTRKR